MRLLAAALVLDCASFGIAADVPVLTAEAAATLFRKSPDFAGRTARTFTRVSRVIVVSDTEPVLGCVVEVEWQEGGKPITGRAVVAVESVAAESAVPPREKLFFSADGWAIPYPLVTGRAADELLTGLQRARIAANEANAKADTRTIISAQMSYAFENDGFYGSLACMATPKDCNPDYSGRAYVDGKLASAVERLGYRRKFYLGPKADRKGATAFAYTAVPLEPGVTGVRGFCGDQSGRLCYTADGSEPDAKGGSCPASCTAQE